MNTFRHSAIAACIAATLVPLSAMAQTRGMISSGANAYLNVNAYGGATNGAALKIVNNCGPAIGDCTWVLRDGMIVNSAKPGLAWNAYGGARHGADVRIVNNCAPSIADCTWTLRNGMIVSNANPNLAVNAYGGATHGAELKLVENCQSSIADCAWPQKFADNALETSLVQTNLGANHYMWTRVKVDKATNRLTASTRIATFTWLGGFTGGVQVSFVDKNGLVLFNTGGHRFGVDGTQIGRSDRTEPWTEDIPADVVAATHRIVVVHYWAPDWDQNLATWLGIGTQFGTSIGLVYQAFQGKAGAGG